MMTKDKKTEDIVFTKIKDLKVGDRDVNVLAKVDFVGQVRTAGYGEEPFVPGMIIDDDGGEIKMTFWGDDVKKAKDGAKIKVLHGYVTEYMGQLQLNASKENGVEFL